MKDIAISLISTPFHLSFIDKVLECYSKFDGEVLFGWDYPILPFELPDNFTLFRNDDGPLGKQRGLHWQLLTHVEYAKRKGYKYLFCTEGDIIIEYPERIRSLPVMLDDRGFMSNFSDGRYSLVTHFSSVDFLNEFTKYSLTVDFDYEDVMNDFINLHPERAKRVGLAQYIGENHLQYKLFDVVRDDEVFCDTIRTLAEACRVHYQDIENTTEQFMEYLFKANDIFNKRMEELYPGERLVALVCNVDCKPTPVTEPKNKPFFIQQWMVDSMGKGVDWIGCALFILFTEDAKIILNPNALKVVEQMGIVFGEGPFGEEKGNE